MIKAKNICTFFGKRQIHNNISFEVKENEIFGILGGSGSGKSVLLKQMLGLEHFDSGEYEIMGIKLRNISDKDMLSLCKKWGVVFQFSALFSFFSVYENLALMLREYTPLREQDIRELVHLKLKMLGLNESVLNQMPSELSGGMQKRVAMARALMLDSKLLFLDEPSSGLDPYSSRELDELILSLKYSLNLSIVLITHDKNTMKNLLERFIILQNGGVGFYGNLASLRAENEGLYKKFME